MKYEKQAKEYEELIRKYVDELPGISNAQIARVMLERENRDEMKIQHSQSVLRQIVGVGRKLFDLEVSPYIVKGISTLRDGNGKVVAEWVKTDLDKERQFEMMQVAIQEMLAEIPQYKPKALLEIDRSPLLLNQYTITDYHLGMMALACVSGEEWNLKLAEDMLVKWFERAIQQSPMAERCVFAQIGDFLHFDGLDAVTPMSKHLLDTDTMYPMLVRVAIRVTRRIIDMLLVKYKHVHVVEAEGNHDMASSVWMREMFSVFYENESRVTVDTNMDPYYHYQWGQVCLFYHHSHLKSARKGLDSAFVAKFKREFGASDYVYAHTGHFHHRVVEETALMEMEQHPTLSAKDAYASRGAYGSQRNAKVITYHKHYGEVGRQTISPEMLK